MLILKLSSRYVIVDSIHHNIFLVEMLKKYIYYVFELNRIKLYNFRILHQAQICFNFVGKWHTETLIKISLIGKVFCLTRALVRHDMFTHNLHYYDKKTFLLFLVCELKIFVWARMNLFWNATTISWQKVSFFSQYWAQKCREWR